MNRKIRLLWDFRGPDANETAKHHAIHLKEFAENRKLPYLEVSTIVQNPYFTCAYIIIYESELSIYKDALKPDRGTVIVES